MEQQFQSLLNEQANAISHGFKVKKIRLKMLNLFNNHETQVSNQLKSVIQAITTASAQEHEAAQNAAKIANIEEQYLTSDLETEFTDLNSEIDDLNARIAELVKSRDTLVLRAKEVQSVINCRKLDKQRAISSVSGPMKSVSELKQEIHTQSETRLQLDKELNAVKSGKMLWQEVIDLLDSLDESIKKLGPDQLPQISFLIFQKINDLSTCLARAQQSNWKGLELAIGHEIELLKTAVNAIQSK